MLHRPTRYLPACVLGRKQGLSLLVMLYNSSQMKKNILGILIFAASSFVLMAADEEEQMKFADGLYARGMFASAIHEYESLMLAFPKSGKADVILFRLAESLRQADREEDADRYYRDIYIKYPNSEYRERAGFRRADMHRRTGKLDNAITLYTLLIESAKSPDIKAASLYYLGEIYLETNKHDEALKMFEQVRVGHPNSEFYAFSLLKLGFIYSSRPKEMEKAYEAYQAVAEKPPTARLGAEALFQIADLYCRQQDYSRSADCYSQLLKQYPDDNRSLEAKVQAGWSQYHAHRYADALTLAEEVLKEMAGGKELQHAAEWLYLKANCQRQLLRNDDAVKTYGQLLEDYPESTFASSACYEKALSSYRAGKYEDAIMVAEAIRVVPGKDVMQEALRKDVYWLLAESYAALKKDDDAVQYYRMIAADFPKSDVAADATYRLAYHLQSRNEFLEASRYYTALVKGFPDSSLAPRALYASGLCLASADRNEEAVRDWSTLTEKYPKDTLTEEALYRKVIAEVRLNRGDTAIETLGRLLDLFPNSGYVGEAHYWRGAMYKDSGKLEDAENELRKSLKLLGSKEMQMDAQFYLAVVLHQLGKTGESADLFTSLLGTSVADKLTPVLLEWLSGYWYGKNDFMKARSCARMMLDKFPDKEWQQIGWALTGRSYLAEKNNAKAEEAYAKALSFEIVTGYAPEAALRLGEIKLAAGVNDKAVECFEKAANISTGEETTGVRAHAYAGLAKAAQARDDMATASKYYMSVAILYDEEKLVSECLYEAVRTFAKQGKREDADKALDELLRRYPNSPFIGQLKGQE